MFQEHAIPEVHMEAKDAVDDIKNLKKKVDAGADHFLDFSVIF